MFEPPLQPDNTTTMANTTTKQQQLLSFTDTQVNQAGQPWCAPFMASACYVELPELRNPPGPFSQFNITDYLKRPMKFTPSGHLYLDTSKYKLMDDQGKAALAQLTTDLAHSATENGFEIVRNGQSGSTKSSQSPFFPAKSRCACFRATQAKPSDPTKVKRTSYHNDRAKNRRENGKKQSRKAESRRPKSSSCLCSFGFVVHCDEFGLYLKTGSGNAMHCNHSQLASSSITASIRTINQESRTELEKLAKSGMSAAQAHNYLHSHEKLRSLSYKQIYRYFNDMNNERIGNLLQKANVPNDCLPSPQSKLINFLRSRSDI